MGCSSSIEEKKSTSALLVSALEVDGKGGALEGVDADALVGAEGVELATQKSNI